MSRIVLGHVDTDIIGDCTEKSFRPFARRHGPEILPRQNFDTISTGVPMALFKSIVFLILILTYTIVVVL